MVLDNLSRIRARIETAARRAGRDPARVELVAVTKKAAPEAVRELLKGGGVRYLGENRVQDAARRKEALGPEAGQAQWRFIGHLQTNKVRQALPLFDWVDSLDSLKLAEALDKESGAASRRLPVLVQVKLTERETQGGVAPAELEAFLQALKPFKSLEPQGLMAIAPMVEPVEAVRPHFRRMKELLDRHFEPGARLSMGMSRDFEVAVEEGADLVRVGTALFEGRVSAT